MTIFICGRGKCEVDGVYVPRTLPPMPRRRCPFEWPKTVQRYGSKQDMYVVAAPCTGKPLKNGWCQTHQYVQEFLELGARLGYPRFQINIALWVGQGAGNWEAYAVCYSAKRQEQVLWALGELIKEMEQVG